MEQIVEVVRFAFHELCECFDEVLLQVLEFDIIVY
jgi:hypothetical protein